MLKQPRLLDDRSCEGLQLHIQQQQKLAGQCQTVYQVDVLMG